MEQTIGKRIMENRKRLGLTQDQLAEKLGVTAQAVSKWENDQSCPDIAMLPMLADIFGISVDELLGRTVHKVYEGEIVSTEEAESEGVHLEKDGFELRFDAGRWGRLAFAVWVLLAGALLLAGQLLHWDVTSWELLWPTGVLVFGVFSFFHRFSVFSAGCVLFGGYFLLSNIGVLNLGLGKNILLPVFFLLFGLSLLLSALRKNKRRPSCVVSWNGKENRKSAGYQEIADGFTFSASFGDEARRVCTPLLTRGKIDVSFGDYTLDFSGVEAVAEDCTVNASCAFGELVLLVPRRYRVKSAGNTAFANLGEDGHPDSDPAGTISLNADVSFGEIMIRYI